MDSSGVQIQLDPVAPPETTKSRETVPGRKRDERDSSRDAGAAALTASFAEILQKQRFERPEPLSRYAPDAPAELEVGERLRVPL